MATREQIIRNMCYTRRHDFGLDKAGWSADAGMTENERQALWNEMADIFDKDIAPHVTLKNDAAAETKPPVIWNKVAWSSGPIGSGYRYSISLEQSSTDTTPANSKVPAFLKAVDGFAQQMNNEQE